MSKSVSRLAETRVLPPDSGVLSFLFPFDGGAQDWRRILLVRRDGRRGFSCAIRSPRPLDPAAEGHGIRSCLKISCRPLSIRLD